MEQADFQSLVNSKAIDFRIKADKLFLDFSRNIQSYNFIKDDDITNAKMVFDRFRSIRIDFEKEVSSEVDSLIKNPTDDDKIKISYGKSFLNAFLTKRDVDFMKEIRKHKNFIKINKLLIGIES